MPQPNRNKTASVNRIIGFSLLLIAVLITIIIPNPSITLRFSIYALFGFSIALIFIKKSGDANISFKARNIGMTIVGGAAIPVALFLTDPIGKFKENRQDALVGTTIFVHGKNGKQDMILRQKGFVIMDVGGERKRASINENGQAFFQNLHIGDSVRLDIDFSEPYKPVNSNSVYVIQPSNNIYLPVALQGIDMVKGMVLYNDDPLEGVTVKLVGKTGYLLDSTNVTGDFSFTIPEQMQTKEYQVWFIKEGYKTKSAPAFPQTGEPLNIVMEKK